MSDKEEDEEQELSIYDEENEFVPEHEQNPDDNNDEYSHNDNDNKTEDLGTNSNLITPNDFERKISNGNLSQEEKHESNEEPVDSNSPRKDIAQKYLSFKDLPQHGKLFIGGLSLETTTDGLRSYFDKYGELLDCVVMRDPHGRSRGFGFVTFMDPRTIDQVLAETHTIDGKEIDPKRAIPKEESALLAADVAAHERRQHEHQLDAAFELKKIFVGGLSIYTDEKTFEDYFRQFGHVTEALLMGDKDSGKRRGFGFITFEDDISVQRVMAQRFHEIDGRTAEIKRAEPKRLAQGSAPERERERERGRGGRGEDRERERDRGRERFNPYGRSHEREARHGHGRGRGRDRSPDRHPYPAGRQTYPPPQYPPMVGQPIQAPSAGYPYYAGTPSASGLLPAPGIRDFYRQNPNIQSGAFLPSSGPMMPSLQGYPGQMHPSMQQIPMQQPSQQLPSGYSDPYASQRGYYPTTAQLPPSQQPQQQPSFGRPPTASTGLETLLTPELAASLSALTAQLSGRPSASFNSQYNSSMPQHQQQHPQQHPQPSPQPQQLQSSTQYSQRDPRMGNYPLQQSFSQLPQQQPLDPRLRSSSYNLSSQQQQQPPQSQSHTLQQPQQQPPPSHPQYGYPSSYTR